MPTQIPDLPAGSPLDGDELAAFRDAISDVKVTADQIADYTIDRMTPAETLAKVIASSPELNGLNSQLLEGLASAFFRDAGNLNAGTVPDARLPTGEYNTTWTSGGEYPDAGSLKNVIKVPEFIFGQRIMIQFGWSNFVPSGSNITATFYEPFVSGWGVENKIWAGVMPEVRRGGYDGTSRPDPRENIEIDVRLRYSDLTKLIASTKRDYGTGTDTARAMWWAIGFY